MPALEILLATPFVRDLIKDESKTPQIKDSMLQDNLRGMQTFDQHLVELCTQGHISLEDAEGSATSPHELKLMLTKHTGRGY